MKKARNACVFAVLMIVLAGCSDTHQSQSPSEQFAIPSDELPSLEAKARDGELAAVRRLIDHFSFSEPDEDKLIYWLRVGAKQGDHFSRVNLAAHLAMRGGKVECKEAEQALREAIADAPNESHKLRAERGLEMLLGGVSGGGKCALKHGINANKQDP